MPPARLPLLLPYLAYLRAPRNCGACDVAAAGPARRIDVHFATPPPPPAPPLRIPTHYPPPLPHAEPAQLRSPEGPRIGSPRTITPHRVAAGTAADPTPAAGAPLSETPAVSTPAQEASPPLPRTPAWRSGGWTLVWLATTVFCVAAAAGFLVYTRIAPPRATLIVPVRPADTTVTLDGEELAMQGELLKISDLTGEREHRIELRREGFVTQSRRIRLQPGEVRVLPKIELRAYRLLAAPALGETTDATDAAVPAARVAQDGSQPAPSPSRTHQPAPNTPRATVHQRTPDHRPGVLRINSLPWSEVSIDDRRIGTTPQQHIVLAPGRHSVSLVNRELGMRRDFDIQITPGSTLTRTISMIH